MKTGEKAFTLQPDHPPDRFRLTREDPIYSYFLNQNTQKN